MKIESLNRVIAEHKESPLVFAYNDETISPGYHVTEVKHAVVTSLDCARGADRWHEIVVQLFDGQPHSTEGYMSGKKFLGIVSVFVESLELERDTELYFEFSPGNGPMHKLSVESASYENNQTQVILKSSSAVCKPFLRAAADLAIDKTQTVDCCGIAKQASPGLNKCCGG